MKLTASSKSGIQGMGFLLIAVGVIMLFDEIQNMGGSLESAKIDLLINPVSIIGVGLVLLPAIMLLFLFFRKNRD
jgi:multisubunit Na+/H+ antiporter MnhG subunit